MIEEIFFFHIICQRVKITQWFWQRHLQQSKRYTKIKSFKHIYYDTMVSSVLHTLSLDQKQNMYLGFSFVVVVLLFSFIWIVCYYYYNHASCHCICWFWFFFFFFFDKAPYLFLALLTQNFNDLFRSYFIATVFTIVISQSNFTNDFFVCWMNSGEKK